MLTDTEEEGSRKLLENLKKNNNKSHTRMQNGIDNMSILNSV